MYATLGEEGLTHGVSQTASKLLVVDAKLLKTVASAIKASKKGTWPCAHVLYIADQPRKADPIVAKSVQESLAALAAAGVSVTTFDDAIAKGAALKRAPTPPAPSDLAVIMCNAAAQRTNRRGTTVRATALAPSPALRRGEG